MTTSSLVKDLIDAGIHFGQRRSNWNPKMGKYIFGERNKIHIIDIRETMKGLLLAEKFIQKVVSEGRDVCFVGTKRQARGSIEKYAADVGMPYVIERWLGGTLTNFRTIRERLKRLIELERLEETGEIQSYSKKMTSQLGREKKKIFRNLAGIRTMTQLPGAIVVVDVTRELNCLREARTLGIPTICLIDTDGDPDFADIPIPGNDDSMRSIEVVVRHLCEAVNRGKSARVVSDRASGGSGEDDGSASSGVRPTSRRRSSTAAFRSASAAAEPAGGEGAIGATTEIGSN